MSICAKEKRLRHMSQDKTPEYILYMELVIMIDVPPNIFFIFWLIEWLIGVADLFTPAKPIQ